MEAGSNHSYTDPTPTASFYAGVGESRPGGARTGGAKSYNSGKNRPCVYCKGKHAPNKCTVTGIKTRKSIIQKGSLCYSCLASSHRSAQCPSTNRCRNCGGKHHTTICDRQVTQATPPTLPLPPPPPENNSETTPKLPGELSHHQPMPSSPRLSKSYII